MALWRFRITLADDPYSRTILDQALAGQRISELNFTPRTARPSEVAGDVVIELPHDDDLGGVLSALHQISRQVLVSRADDATPPGDGARADDPTLTDVQPA
jgi:hypothetical protein